MKQLINKISNRINQLEKQGVSKTDPRYTNAVECLRRCGYKMHNNNLVSIH